MKPRILFIDLEAEPENGRIWEYGLCDLAALQYRGADARFVAEQLRQADYIVGHNLLAHDLPILLRQGEDYGPNLAARCIDSLYVSVLCYPHLRRHNLEKTNKLQEEAKNNPLWDAQQCGELFEEARHYYSLLSPGLRLVLYRLLGQEPGLQAFFRLVGETDSPKPWSELLAEVFESRFCRQAYWKDFVEYSPQALGFALAALAQQSMAENLRLATWLNFHYPQIQTIIDYLRHPHCGQCSYCQRHQDPLRGLQTYFGFSAYRAYEGQPLQEEAVRAALGGESIVVVFPTGGGKSITFQVPAFMAGAGRGALTVVISPLQSLMKDQVDNLERLGHSRAATLNGLLDPIERSQAFERVENGQACLLYLSPEALRSNSIERLLGKRRIARFVIDEAHCLSAWGQDFRIDYLYIAEFIKKLEIQQQQKIPVSCFTATAKPSVIEDIQTYFKSELDLDLRLISASVRRHNLHYRVYKSASQDKYPLLRDLIQQHSCPSIVYVTRTRQTEQLAELLRKDGINAQAYHGKMDSSHKVETQNRFMQDEVQVIVATSAFGMGVDKKDVGLVVHYEISDSLENYVQEAGRAGRDQSLQANCFVLFQEEDLSKHFMMLNTSKLNLAEIQHIWKAIKDLCRHRKNITLSALELARRAGWSEEAKDIETRVRSAVAALEQAGYVKRGNNLPKIYATSLRSRYAQEALDRIEGSELLNPEDKIKAKRIVRRLHSSRRIQQAQDEGEVGEAQVDYLADQLGLSVEEVIKVVGVLREIGILADDQDLELFLPKNRHKSRRILQEFEALEHFLSQGLVAEGQVINLKKANEAALLAGHSQSTVAKLRTILILWDLKRQVRLSPSHIAQQEWQLNPQSKPETLMRQWAERRETAKQILEQLYKSVETNPPAEDKEKKSEDWGLLSSIESLRQALSHHSALFSQPLDGQAIEDALFYLSRIGALRLEGGFMVLYNRLSIERREEDNRILYKKEDYRKLENHYKLRSQQIHIVGRYAELMSQDLAQAQRFVEDYFSLDYERFIKTYFPSREERLQLSRNLSPRQFERIFGGMSEAQKAILDDEKSANILVAAGPGSGKTRVLVHKLAAMLLLEDVKPEHLLMLTFSRAAATEFKLRLRELVGDTAYAVQIRTFHSYSFEILGRPGKLEGEISVQKLALQALQQQEIEPSILRKTVLVVDEAQDMAQEDWDLVLAIRDYNKEGIRLLLVGDDDQNIYGFRGADARYMRELLNLPETKLYELGQNYRSAPGILQLSNSWIQRLPQRLKQQPIEAMKTDMQAELSLHSYHSPNFMPGLLADIQAKKGQGSIALLCRSNEEALLLHRLLLHQGHEAELIQQQEGYRLHKLRELHFVLDRIRQALEARKSPSSYIPKEVWQESLATFKAQFAHKRSLVFQLCERMLERFDELNKNHKYLSDLELFLSESGTEDFAQIQQGRILVSTLHKAKGKEFDQVFIYLSQLYADTEADIRSFYVALTRAKQGLYIHARQGLLDRVWPELPPQYHEAIYPPEREILLQGQMRDVYLDNLAKPAAQALVQKLQSGSPLIPEPEACRDKTSGLVCLQFSKRFKESLQTWLERGYQLKKARVQALVWWWHEKSGQEILVPLPEILLEKPWPPFLSESPINTDLHG